MLYNIDTKQDIPVCKRCGRRLKTSEARRLGMGKICFEKSQQQTTKPLIKR